MVSTTPPLAQSGRLPPQFRSFRPAGFFSRFEAFIIDQAIISTVQLASTAIIQTVLEFFKLSQPVANIITILQNSVLEFAISAVFISSLFIIGYYTFFWTLVGFTPGKAILGLKVVRCNGANLSFGRSILRFFSYWISAIPFFLGFLWVLWDPNRQSWHDKIADTQVLYIPKNPHK